MRCSHKGSAETVGAALAIALALLAACGDNQQQAGGPSGDLDLSASAQGLVEVAEVNGSPVYDDCVRLQAETGVDKRTALQQCIDFELLAQEAERKGYASAPAALETRKREAARSFIEQEFVPTFASPENVPESVVKKYWATHRSEFNHPEFRFAAHALARMPDGAELGSEEDRKARKTAEELHALFEGKKWDPEEFLATASRYKANKLTARLVAALDPLTSEGAPADIVKVLDAVAGAATATPMIVQDLPRGFPAGGGGRYAVGFADATFAIPRAGMVSPPARTEKFGWHVILLVNVHREQRHTYEEAAPKIRKKLFGRERFAAFLRWQNKLAAASEIEVDEQALTRMVEAERERDPLSKLEKTR